MTTTPSKQGIRSDPAHRAPPSRTESAVDLDLPLGHGKLIWNGMPKHRRYDRSYRLDNIAIAAFDGRVQIALSIPGFCDEFAFRLSSVAARALARELVRAAEEQTP